jgi:hypothetical protein
MAFDIKIGTKDSLDDIESQVRQLLQKPSPATQFRSIVSSDRRGCFFKDIWGSIAVATGVERSNDSEVIAWGLQNWEQLEDEEGFALSYPSLIALQREARVVTDSVPIDLDAALVKRRLIEVGGILGTGARQRTIVELDPDLPMAARLTSGARRRDAFFEFARTVLAQLQIGALARKHESTSTRESGAKGTILEFLYELHTNAFEHGRTESNVRTLRLQKHQYPHRRGAQHRASAFNELARYIETQPERPSNRVFNLVEASVSDYGPGILDGFLNTFAGSRHRNRSRRELLDALLHDQLSSKSSDPNAGLGIIQALTAARDIDAFVSLRTAEFWLTMQGRLGEQAQLAFRAGEFPKIVGTHWQLLLPDPTDVDRLGTSSA